MLKILIATPAYGGQLTTKYCGSLMTTIQYAARDKIGIKVLFLDNESLIQRARNKCAWYALEEGQADKLMFIDADIGWTYENFKRIATANKEVIGGTYPVKQLPSRLNYNLLIDAQTDLSGVIEVKHLPTGFMCININTLRKLTEYAPTYDALDTMGLTDGSESVTMWDLFPCGVRDGIFESEDWGFCSFAREHGVRIWLDTDVVCTHTGTYTFTTEDCRVL